MINPVEIKEKARLYGIPESSIERDYAQNWLLKYLAKYEMVLKGGTGIRKIYISEYRFSDDLDFTLIKKFNLKQISQMTKTAVIKAKEASGIIFTDNVVSKENDNGFEAMAYFSILQRASNTQIGIKLDFTRQDKEQILLQIAERRINHIYSDKCRFSIKAYSLEEIVAEKVRALFERTRPRDVYDVWYLKDKISSEKVIKILSNKFRFKNVKYDINSIRKRKMDFANAWLNSLTHQIKHLPDFKKAYSTLIEYLKSIDFSE